jgi:hypothetical protein
VLGDEPRDAEPPATFKATAKFEHRHPVVRHVAQRNHASETAKTEAKYAWAKATPPNQEQQK